MIVAIALFYLLLCVALAAGQFRVILRAVRKREAGIGRFTYRRDTQAFGFWAMLVLEIAGLAIVLIYVLGALFAVGGSLT